MSSLTVAEALAWSKRLDSDTARLDVELLLLECLQKERSYLFAWPEAFLTAAQQRQFDQLFQRRYAGEPVAHIIGYREFWDLSLKVNSSTLIPRPDTELLVELALEKFDQAEIRVLDLGTGTGAIALALANERRAWRIDAVDSSEQAVNLARENQRRHSISGVDVYLSDWFSAVPQTEFDLIISNPPYIDPQDEHLQQGDVRFEPLSALVAGDHGLADIDSIIQQAPNYLKPSGVLMIEHGYDQAVTVQERLAVAGFEGVAGFKDLAGNDRVSLACWNKGLLEGVDAK